MSRIHDSEDLFGDNLNENCENVDDVERIIEGDDNDDNIDENKDENNENEDAPRKLEIKQRVVRNPQPRLNPQRLSGPRGVHTIESYYKDVKFGGKGHERNDINKIMKRLEHWAHRLFPKYNFDDSIEKIEKLGSKRTVISYMNSYRHGTLQPDLPGLNTDLVEDDYDEPLATPMDEMDELLGQQITVATNAQNQSINRDVSFNSLFDTPSRLAQPLISSTPYTPKTTTVTSADVILTEEQKQTMALNKKLALERLQAKKRQMESVIEIHEQSDSNTMADASELISEPDSTILVQPEQFTLDISNKEFTIIPDQSVSDSTIFGHPNDSEDNKNNVD